MARSRPVPRSALYTTVICLLGASLPVLAQAPAPPGDQLEDVIVTATRRSEKLQDVAISMTAVTGAQLENFGDKSFTDYAASIPNLAQSTGAGAGGNGNAFGVSSTRAIAIRGVFGNNTTGFYLNDTPVPMSLDPRVVDIDHLEVLRGPQGTLFGQGSMGGTVRLVTRDPSLDVMSGKVDLEGTQVDHGGGGYSAQGTFNAPLIKDNVALRISGYSAFDPGLFTRTWGEPQDPRSPSIAFPPGGAPVGHKDHVGAEQGEGYSVTLKITPEAVPGLSITPMYMYQHTNTNGYPLADYTADNFTQTRPLNVPEAVEDTWSFGSLSIKHESEFGRVIATGTYFYRRAYDLEDTTDSHAIVFWGLPYYVPAPLPNVLNTRTWNGEVRFESTFKGPVNFVVGFFDSVSERRFRENYLAPGLDAASGYTIGTDLEYVQNTPNADRERAEFIDVNYKPTDKWEFSAGVRRAYLAHEGAYTASGPLNGGTSGPPDTYSEAHQYQTAPRYTAKYQYLPDQMVYASAAKGFRIGGTNSLLPPICDGDLAALGLKNGAAFNSDSLWSYEIGSKNTFLDNRIRTRAAAYKIKWKGIQQSVYLPCTFNLVANSGAAESTGAEFEMDVAVIDHLTLNLSAGYEDAKITEATEASRTIVGQPLTGVPRWSGSTSAQYVIPLGERSAFFRAQYEFTSARTSFNNVPPDLVDANNQPLTSYRGGGRALSSYGLVNLRTGVNQGPWELTLSLRNVFNKLGVIGDLIPEGAELAGRPKLFVTRPRTVGLELKREF